MIIDVKSARLILIGAIAVFGTLTAFVRNIYASSGKPAIDWAILPLCSKDDERNRFFRYHRPS